MLAAEVVAGVIHYDGSLATRLPMVLDQVQDKDRPLLQELCYGTLRHFFSLREHINKHLSKPLKEKDRDIYSLLLIGAYQLLHTRIPAYAAINSSVNAANTLKKTWAKGLINAVLRNIQREMEASEKENPEIETAVVSEESRYDHPQWLIDQIKTDHSDCAKDIFIANNTKAPMTLRVNRLQHSRADYSRLLTDENISHHVTESSELADFYGNQGFQVALVFLWCGECSGRSRATFSSFVITR